MSKTCKTCGSEIEQYCEFPSKTGGTICMSCYEKEQKNTTAGEMYDTIMGAFGNGGIINKSK